MDLASIPLFDSVLLAVLILFVVHGLWVGFFRQLPFVIALIGSYAASCQYAGDLMPHVGQLTGSPRIVFGGSFIILLIISTLLFKLIGKLIRKVIQIKAVGWGNRFFLGGAPCPGQGCCFCCSCYYVFSSHPLTAKAFFS